jgi:hypothetical protein
MAAPYQNGEVYGPDLATLIAFVGVPWLHTFQQVFINKHTRLRKKKLAPSICDYTLELVKAGRMKTFSNRESATKNMLSTFGTPNVLFQRTPMFNSRMEVCSDPDPEVTLLSILTVTDDLIAGRGSLNTTGSPTKDAIRFWRHPKSPSA